MTVDYGQEPATKTRYCPLQRAWGLLPQQKITPGLAEKLCCTAVTTTSYEQSTALAARWAVPVNDTLIHQQMQRAGERADQQAWARVTAAPPPPPKPLCRRARW